MVLFRKKYKIMGNMNRSAFVLFFILAAFEISGGEPLGYEGALKLYPQTVSARDFGAVPDDGKDDAKALRDAVSAAKKLSGNGGVRIVLGPGRYDLLSESNNTAVPLTKSRNIMIDGAGATLVQHNQWTNFLVIGSENTTLANMNFETAALPYAGAKVIAHGDSYFDCEILSPYSIREVHPKAIITYDRTKDALNWLGSDIYQLFTKLRIKKLSETTMRVPLEKHNMRKIPAVGSYVVIRYEVYGPSVFNIMGSENTRIYNIDIYTHSGMGVYGSNSRNILIDNLNIAAKSRDFWMTTTADATHFNYCRGKIEILNSRFEKMGDDATNVHQMYWILREKITPLKIRIAWGKKSKPAPIFLPRIGDKIAFGESNNWFRFGAFSEVIKIDSDAESKTWILDLNTPLPDYVCKGMPMGNVSADPKLIIRNCKVRGNRARGFLIKVSEAIIENCSFDYPTGAAILMENDADYWYEGFRTQKVAIRNCRFNNCNAVPAKSATPAAAILDAVKFSKGMPCEGYVNGTTTIENCIFENNGPAPIKLHQTQNPVYKNITIRE